MEPLHLISALAFGHAPEDTLALAGEALSRIWSNDGRMLWQFTQTVTRPRHPPGDPFFKAMAVYTRRYQDVFSGGRAQATESVRLTVTGNVPPHDPGFSGLFLDFSDSFHGVGAMEAIVVATCTHITQMLLERGWISPEQAPGFWQMHRRWSSPIVAKALNGGQTDLAAFMVVLQPYGLFTAITPEAVDEAIWVRRLFQA